MTTIGFALEKWTKLKKVALSFTADEDFFTWGWHDSPHIPTVDQRSIWEHAIPPSDRWPTEEFSDSLDRLREDASIDDPEKIEVIDSAQFKIHFENDLLEHDLAYLMRLWQEKNEPSLARFMRNLGDCCPSLEQIDWYPLGGGDPRTLWRWNFLRELRDDNRKVKRVMGNLSWEGCTQGDPDPMVALVGQEWEHHVSVHMKRRY
ncbi:hypothetical protein QCA50_002351 [Cerrena zonata]|uniref:Uncharacterized protein n=1 Tax=Cerrena zonata TaxID=2478898 RepID=A0AAW0GZ10_9APHY